MTPSDAHTVLSEAHRLLHLLRLPCYLFICPQEYWKHGDHHAYHKRLTTGKCAIIFNPHLEIFSESATRTSQNVTLHEAAHHVCKCKCADIHCKHFAKELLKLYELTDTPLPRSSKFQTVRALLP